MNKKSIPIFLSIFVTLCLILPAIPAEETNSEEVFTGVASATGSLSSSRSEWIRIRISRWTTPDERDLLKRTLAEKGHEAMVALLRSMKPVGSIGVQGGVGYDLRYARQMMEDGQRKIVLATDRWIGFREFAQSEKSLEYSVTVIQLSLNSEGKGKGTVSPAVKVMLDPKGAVDIERYATDPVKITSLRKEK